MSSAGSRRILVVEDEAMVAMLIEDILHELGYNVVGPVSRVDSALAAVADGGFDAALLDVNLVGGPSYPIADTLDSLECPFIFVTGYGSAGLDPDYRRFPVMQKPFNRDTLAQALAELFQSRE